MRHVQDSRWSRRGEIMGHEYDEYHARFGVIVTTHTLRRCTHEPALVVTFNVRACSPPFPNSWRDDQL